MHAYKYNCEAIDIGNNDDGDVTDDVHGANEVDVVRL